MVKSQVMGKFEREQQLRHQQSRQLKDKRIDEKWRGQGVYPLPQRLVGPYM